MAMTSGRRVALLPCLCLVVGVVQARGVSPYLPLRTSPEIERDIQHLFTSAQLPLLRKPWFVADVEQALQRACDVPSAMCTRVRLHLERYRRTAGITEASGLLRSTENIDKFVPNQRGMKVSSRYSVAARGYWQPNDYLLLTASGVAWEDEAIPTAILSFGFDAMQVDIGWRERWWSPFQDSATMVSTNALPSPSITISNHRPLTFLNFRYEVFYADLEETDGILFQGTRSSGRPGLFGVHLGIEPAQGFSIAVNRVMQFGGDGRSKSLSTMLKAFFDPSGRDNTDGDLAPDDEAGNQLASITTRFDSSGRFPFSVYMEYAGEDTSSSENFRLGNTALSVGLFLPQVTPRVDATYEFSEFQNAWYVSGIYANGYTNEGSIIGHWAGNERQFGDGVGTQVHTLLFNWELPRDNLLHATVRTIDNQDTSAVGYVRGYEGLLRYSHGFSNFVGGAELYGGRTVFDDSFAAFGIFVRW